MSDVHTSLGFRKAMNEDVVIIGGARTPFCEWVGGKRGDGKSGGALKTVSAQELGAIAIKGALEKTGTDASKVDHVVMGYALQTCSQSIYGARHAGLKAGIPQEVPMLTLSRICGSGIQSIVSGAQMIMLGEADTVVSGGMENLSQAPHILRGARDGWRLGRSPKVEDYITSYPKDGNNTITTKLAKKDWELIDEQNQLGRIWINEEQYFDSVPLIAWEFYIGGYQPAQKWLKDRKGRELKVEDILHYQKIIVALSETSRMMQEIDTIEIE